ncbi:phenylalanyl-tRNA synthetase subunit alpha [Pedobacter psychroterrae]|uniref:Phenylalanyl-tRNA synthetase subunit alpha n=1 Tax=Pedobacter psychroterrae TaxID=2530453 RepID=A0A4R0NTT3_9SPHI|nr:phenylalanyl-tRNA synthetase subunit alpha [Pedobacter psychroterrae]TCD02434.1 phenylalanyl-tRNA synthetase subunit alpha [Pedobacter psychroterrae]
MSKEILEISVMVDEKFDVSFNLVNGFFGFILKVFGK